MSDQHLVAEFNKTIQNLYALVPPEKRQEGDVYISKLLTFAYALHGTLQRLEQVRTVTLHAKADVNHYLEQLKRMTEETKP
jgi:hypothetical protein